jgi:hypothetical protein
MYMLGHENPRPDIEIVCFGSGVNGVGDNLPNRIGGNEFLTFVTGKGQVVSIAGRIVSDKFRRG